MGAAGRARPRGPSAPPGPNKVLGIFWKLHPVGDGPGSQEPTAWTVAGADQRDIDEDMTSTVHSHVTGTETGSEAKRVALEARMQTDSRWVGWSRCPHGQQQMLETKNNCAGGLIFKRRVSCASAQVTQAPHPTAPLQEPEWTRAAWPSMEATLPPSTHHARHPPHPGQQAHAPLPVTPCRPQPGLPALTQAEVTTCWPPGYLGLDLPNNICRHLQTGGIHIFTVFRKHLCRAFSPRRSFVGTLEQRGTGWRPLGRKQR